MVGMVHTSLNLLLDIFQVFQPSQDYLCMIQKGEYRRLYKYESIIVNIAVFIVPRYKNPLLSNITD